MLGIVDDFRYSLWLSVSFQCFVVLLVILILLVERSFYSSWNLSFQIVNSIAIALSELVFNGDKVCALVQESAIFSLGIGFRVLRVQLTMRAAPQLKILRIA